MAIDVEAQELEALDGIERVHAVTESANSAQRWEALTLLNVNRTLAIAKSGGHADVKAHYAPLIKATSAEISEMQKGLEEGLSSDQDRALFQGFNRFVARHFGDPLLSLIHNSRGQACVICAR